MSAQATETVRAALPNAEPLPVGRELQDWWFARLPKGEREILELLIDAHPRSVPRAEMDGPTGFARSSRDAYLSRLAAKELVVAQHGGEVRASDNLFEEARRG